MKIILVLGSPNEPDGTLSAMAVSRLDVCINLYKEGWDKIVLTGGFGTHFNTSPMPHAHYLRRDLMSKGVDANDILALVESRHSVEDATLSKWIVDDYKPEEIAIVTSDYHARRTRIIFDAVYAPFDRFHIVAASSEAVDGQLLRQLIEHEHKAVSDLLENGVRF